MKDEYDFSNMRSRKNPYAKILQKQSSIAVRVLIASPSSKTPYPHYTETTQPENHAQMSIVQA